MNIPAWRTELELGVRHIAKHDDVLRPYTLLAPVPRILPHANHYQELVESIISQQLSVKAAATITKRFVELYGGTFPAPEAILDTEPDELRGVGLSASKAGYIRDLALHVIEKKLRFDGLDDMSNEAIIAMLTDVKGIGEWTAHMFLIFSLGRFDVLAYGDLGIKNGIKALYGLDHTPTPEEVREIAHTRHWTPYESIACWYVWRSLDHEPTA